MFEEHYQFSENYPIEFLGSEELVLYQQLNQLKEELNFPAIRNDIGSLFNTLLASKSESVIFEFGSGYGHSAFWYFLNQNSISKVYLTEKRTDLLQIYKDLSFPPHWKNKIEYYQGDAFDLLKSVSGFDFVLIDGQKNDYTDFLKQVLPKINRKGVIAIDNAFWKGSILVDGISSKKSTQAMREHHHYLKELGKQKNIKINYIPFRDGLILIQFD